ncbi:leucine-rich repeat receptor-like serine/threonine-protein kinase SKM1 [Salvia hispanica]|uniref:leucine-rich repeat receptor-like serine/threonine-protein kinase SKM1 n=1 Tax=Salvia hispanica TaxID=49212 RepID=UPI00200998A6|nr:leucine-rich repeat receptor-like serine/threonine-protein kinase SKM1 [Salvia hispanica]
MAPLSLLLLLAMLMPSHSTTHPQDVQALKQLKRTISPSTIPPSSCISSWDFSLDPCDSLFSAKFTCGLRCDASSNSDSNSTLRVTDISLDPAGYSAPLSSIPFSSLPFLQTLDLSSNNFSGPIPSSLSLLPLLRRLSLSRNSLSGPIPPSLSSLSLLQQLYLDNNLLTDSIPPLNLPNLNRLELQSNQLTASLPDLTLLPNLNFLDASDNSLSGALPSSLPPSLIELVARNNQFDGEIPSIEAPSLQVLDLSHNKLTGSVPASFFTHPNLEQLTLSFNQLESVETPADSGLTSPLISVDLSNNRVRGFLPGFMGLMPRLSALSLENNELTGPIPIEYAMKVLGSGLGSGSAQFERLLLGGNYLFGAIPGGFLDLKAGSLTVRLGDNCLYRCPLRYFFCEGGVQKSFEQCRALGPFVP